jgi:hypothetical protein
MGKCQISHRAKMKLPAVPLKRDPPKVDKSPPHYIGGQVRFASTSSSVSRRSRIRWSECTAYGPKLQPNMDT